MSGCVKPGTMMRGWVEHRGISSSCIEFVFLPNIVETSMQRSIQVRKKPIEKQLPATPGNAKHKSRQVKKKNGDTSNNNAQGQG